MLAESSTSNIGTISSVIETSINKEQILDILIGLGISLLNRDMECPSIDEISAFALGKLDKENYKFIESHVIKCSICLDRVMTLRAIPALAKERKSRLTTT